MNIEAQNELKRLLEGNKRFVANTPKEINKSLETLKKFTNYQEPKALVLSCSDSRVVPEIIFDCGIGELFVVRVAGIGIGPNVLESIEFGIAELGIPLLILLGHDNCGVMTYAKEHYPEPMEDFYALMNSVYPVLGNPESTTDEIAKKHTEMVKNILLKRSLTIKEAYEQHKLNIACAHFKFDTGEVELI